MNKEQENQFKEHIKEMAREEIQRTFTDNLMETLNSAFIFKYVETLELKCKKQKERIEYLERSNNRREDTVLEQRQKIGDLEDNWNKLKEYIGSGWYCFDNESVEFEVAKSILNKMQELEGSDSNVKD